MGLHPVAERPDDRIGIAGVYVFVHGDDHLAPHRVEGIGPFERLPDLGGKVLLHADRNELRRSRSPRASRRLYDPSMPRDVFR